ncbi:MAG: rhomboid family intramembrane serine protease [Alphaproteobacteria bacterium]|nr:rhomboid family intramembrane serine protease [Alphaproteobacteria bacterium]
MPDPIPFRPRQAPPGQGAPGRPPSGRRLPVATVLIGLVLVAGYLWQSGLGVYGEAAVVRAYGLIPAELFGLRSGNPAFDGPPPIATLVTAQFLHGGMLHLLGNVVAILLAGILVERRAGSLRSLLVFFGAGIVGLAVEAAAEPGSSAPIIGASAGAAGLIGAVLRLDPRGHVSIPWLRGGGIKLASVAVMPLIVVWLILQVAGIAFGAGEPVAFLAHGAGFVAGVLLAGGARRAA